MKAANTSETSVNFYQTTWRNNPEDRHVHTRRRENLKSHFHVLLILKYTCPRNNVFFIIPLEIIYHFFVYPLVTPKILTVCE
jgi:hypothetical protein